MRTSVTELFKIGIGPSSSHTVGPMRAATAFVRALQDAQDLERCASVRVDLYGSLALTGKGHATDRAILLGLAGHSPASVNPDSIDDILAGIRSTRVLPLLGIQPVAFDEQAHIVWYRSHTLSGHSNGMRFSAFDSSGALLLEQVYYSIGGGFIQREGEALAAADHGTVPHPFTSAQQLLDQCSRAGLRIWELMRVNETSRLGSVDAVEQFLDHIWSVMSACIERGLHQEGILPGGLKVKRRAPRIHARLVSPDNADPMASMDWLNVFAMAVNEENAAGGRVVTAPTNGAAGLLPAVIRYYRDFMGGDAQGIRRFLLAAGAIGILYKENASISGAEVGCQGEVGVACSMAAAGLASALGAGNEAVEHAAEIGMEHHLGMTCDPIGGLVQIPCIERNAIGAVKAVNACRMAMQDDGDHKVSLDQVIKTMFETGRDMQARYKETSLGGLAINVIEC